MQEVVPVTLHSAVQMSDWYISFENKQEVTALGSFMSSEGSDRQCSSGKNAAPGVRIANLPLLTSAS